jgi:FAD/FMN-containing dehydrogenase
MHDSELFRACRGAGGGNFGIITNFSFDKLPSAPREVAESEISFSWDSMTEEKFTRILTSYGDYWEGRGKDPDTWGLFGLLDLGSRSHPHGRIGCGVQFCNPDGTVEDLSVLHEFFDRFAELRPDPLPPDGNIRAGRSNESRPDAPPSGRYPFYEVTRRPWLDATIGEGGGGGPARAKYKSAYMKKTFTPAECSAIYRYLTSSDAGAHGAVLAVDSYGGAVNNPERVDDTAINQRSSIMKLQWQCYWRQEEEDAGHLKFMDEFFTGVYTGSHVPAKYQGTPMGERYEGCYMNYADADMLRYSYWPQLYYGTGDLYPLLQRVKRRYDPNNIFHSSMSIRA